MDGQLIVAILAFCLSAVQALILVIYQIFKFFRKTAEEKKEIFKDKLQYIWNNNYPYYFKALYAYYRQRGLFDKEIDLKDIHLLYVDADNLCVSPIDELDIKFINQFAPIIKNKKTILFRMNLQRIAEILEPMEVKICYVSNRVTNDLKEKINSYIDIEELQWGKEV